MSERVINYVCFGLAFVAFVLNLTANSSDRWWVSLKPQEFENVGLWQICFNHYRHRFDFYVKMARWQQNWYGWSFILAVVSFFLQVIVGKILNLINNEKYNI